MKKKYVRILKEINDKIPRELLENLTVKEKQFATLKQILEKATLEPDLVVPPDKKRKYREVLASGYLEKEVEVINKSVEEQIEAFVTFEIEKAVKLGRLPKQAPTLKLLNNKGKKYARRQADRLNKLFNQPPQVLVGEAQDTQERSEGDSPRGSDLSVLPPSGSERAGEGSSSEARDQGESARGGDQV